MGREALERLLQDSLLDCSLDQEERRSLRDQIDEHCASEEDANWIRNRAFDLVSERVNADNYGAVIRWLERVLKIARYRPQVAPPHLEQGLAVVR